MNSQSPQWLVFLLLIAAGIVLLLQNSQPLPLVLLNQPLPIKLPLSFWVILAVIAGMITSVLVQLLMGAERKGGDRPTPKFNKKLESLKERPQRQPDRRTGRSDWERSRANYDWTDKELEEADEENWDIESPPDRPTRPQSPPVTEKARPEPQPERPRPEPAPPRRAPNPKPKAENGVYDADYRVITPPYAPDEEPTPPPVNIEDDEEWI